MLRLFAFCFLSLLMLSFQQPASFKQEQLKFTRVKEAFAEEEKDLTAVLRTKGIQEKELEIFIRAFKEEAILEVWYRKKGESMFTGCFLYNVCTGSGDPGPKRKAGDGQVPEGCYHIDRFNPFSNYHLSLGVSYPNESDKILGMKGNLGGDIFIHGSCVSIGCLPVHNSIKQVYVLAVLARDAGQKKIPVHIFPFKMSGTNLNRFAQDYPGQRAFWTNLKEAYDFFEEKHALPLIRIDTRGKYGIIK